MGGPNSGNWYRYDKKSTVEESLVLPVSMIRNRLFHGAAGTFIWRDSSGSGPAVHYSVTMPGDIPIVTLSHHTKGGEDVRVSIRMQTTVPRFGGRRWWFTCPLIVRGVACNGRVSKLCLAPGARYFGCRKCHNLTYRSSQEAHQAERAFARRDADAEVIKLFMERWGQRE